MYEINLSQITEKGNNKITSLGGKDNGLAAAEKLNIVDLAKKHDTIKIIVPRYIKGFHSSYFAGLFSQIISDLGNSRCKFENKFIFDADDKILEQINDGIDLCFMDTSAVRIKK